MNRLTPEQLAQAVRDEELSFEDALIYHMLNNVGTPIEGVGLFYALSIAIGWGSMNCWDETIDLPGGTSSVADIIERFQLRAFLES